MILALVLLSASCKTLISAPLLEKKAEQMSNMQLAARHDVLLDCNREGTTDALAELKIIEALEDVNAILLNRAIEYLHDLRLDADFYSQPAKAVSK